MRALLLALAAFAAGAPADEQEPATDTALEPSAPDSFIARAIYANDRLWVLTDGGHLTSLTARSERRDESRIAERVLDICRTPQGVAALVCADDGCGRWNYLELKEGQWQHGKSVSSRGDQLIALHCEAVGSIVVTNRRAIDMNRPESALRFTRTVQTGVAATAFLDARYIYVGINKGEWGGGLTRINRKSGAIEKIHRNESGELCGGPLNEACDPVHAIIASPKTGCVLAAVGLVHFDAHGRIAEICGRSVFEFYSSDCTLTLGEGDNVMEMPGTDAFFGLAPVSRGFVAVGLCGIYRFEDTEGPRCEPQPKFRQIDGVWVNFDQPELVLVMTNINRRAAVSGLTPLLVPR